MLRFERFDVEEIKNPDAGTSWVPIGKLHVENRFGDQVGRRARRSQNAATPAVLPAVLPGVKNPAVTPP